MIKLTRGTFTILPKGENVLKIVGVTYKQALGHMIIDFENEDNIKHKETYRFITKAGKKNEGALNAFSYFAHTAMNNFDLDEIDEQELVGKFVKVTVEHDVQPNINDPSKNVTFVRISNYQPSLGFAGKTVDPLDELD